MDHNLPKHIAIVMDGNGRWAEARGMSRLNGHIAGIETVKETIRACLEKNIQVLSLFAFSCENWLRPTDEVTHLMSLFAKTLSSELTELSKYEVCLRFSGRRSQLPGSLQNSLQKAEIETKNNKRMVLNIAFDYSGHWDILQATRNIASLVANNQLEPSSIDEDFFKQFLSTANLPEPDLFIRTSGELRLSNFFLWQLAYTELYFTPVYWPDFSKEELEKALFCFQNRERRFGKLSKE